MYTKSPEEGKTPARKDDPAPTGSQAAIIAAKSPSKLPSVIRAEIEAQLSQQTGQKIGEKVAESQALTFSVDPSRRCVTRSVEA